MWSDPEDIDTWAVSPRGAGWLFGGSVTREVYKSLFAHTLNLPSTTIVQSHERLNPHSPRTPAGSRGL